MIHCPYCGSEMGDDARACPRCRSLMISDERPHHGALPRWLHPLTALVFVLLVSAALLAVDLKPWGKGKSLAPLAPEPDIIPASVENDNGGSPSPAPVPAAAPDPATGLYKEVNDYVSNVKDALNQADGVAGELDKLAQQNDKNKVTTIREKISQLQHFTSRLRSIGPPAALAGAHTRLCNSQAVRGRAYRSLAMYMQSGDTKRLDRATSELQTAQQGKDAALAEIMAYRDKIPAPAEPAPAPEPAAPEPPPPANQPVLPPPALEPPAEPPAEPAPAEGASTAGATAPAPAEGATHPDQLEQPLVPDDAAPQQLPRIRP